MLLRHEELVDGGSLILLVRLLDACCKLSLSWGETKSHKRNLERQGDSEPNSQQSGFSESGGGEQEGRIVTTVVNIIDQLLKGTERQSDPLHRCYQCLFVLSSPLQALKLQGRKETFVVISAERKVTILISAPRNSKDLIASCALGYACLPSSGLLVCRRYDSRTVASSNLSHASHRQCLSWSRNVFS